MTQLVSNTVVDSCGSTNDLARELAASGAPHGSWISARSQTQGRGRLAREWVSEVGNLYLSLVVRDIPLHVLTLVPLVAGLGVRRAIREQAPSLDVRLKWPNDLWLNGAKLGGILCEAVHGASSNYGIIGIGVNCAKRPSLSGVPTADLFAAGITSDELRPRVIAQVLERIKALSSGESAQVLSEYEDAAQFPPGTLVQWSNGAGTVLGLGPQGQLVVRTPDGSTRDLVAEDVSQLRTQ